MDIWNHKNNVIFNNHKCNPVDVIKQARNTYRVTLLYDKNTSTVRQMDITSRNIQGRN